MSPQQRDVCRKTATLVPEREPTARRMIGTALASSRSQTPSTMAWSRPKDSPTLPDERGRSGQPDRKIRNAVTPAITGTGGLGQTTGVRQPDHVCRGAGPTNLLKGTSIKKRPAKRQPNPARSRLISLTFAACSISNRSRKYPPRAANSGCLRTNPDGPGMGSLPP